MVHCHHKLISQLLFFLLSLQVNSGLFLVACTSTFIHWLISFLLLYSLSQIIPFTFRQPLAPMLYANKIDQRGRFWKKIINSCQWWWQQKQYITYTMQRGTKVKFKRLVEVSQHNRRCVIVRKVLIPGEGGHCCVGVKLSGDGDTVLNLKIKNLQLSSK